MNLRRIAEGLSVVYAVLCVVLWIVEAARPAALWVTVGGGFALALLWLAVLVNERATQRAER